MAGVRLDSRNWQCPACGFPEATSWGEPGDRRWYLRCPCCTSETPMPPLNPPRVRCGYVLRVVGDDLSGVNW